MRIAYRNFTGGEVSPSLLARYDLRKSGSFLAACLNAVPAMHGDVDRRPGTAFIGLLSGASVLWPFQFNSDPDNCYILAFQAGKIQIAQADGILEAELESPYSVADAYGLSLAQVADVLYIAHRDYALRKITRAGSAPYEWAIQTVAINQSLPPPSTPSVTWHSGTGAGSGDNLNATLRYVITSVGEDGVESIASSVGSCTGRYPTDWIQGDRVDISWSAVEGADEYNVYRESAGYFGFIGVAKSTAFQDQNYEPDTAQTPKRNWSPFKKGNNPACCTFHQQRLWLGGGAKTPSTVYASRTGDYENFRKSQPVQDDDALEFSLAAGAVDDIKWIVSFGDLLVGTAGAEYRLSASKGSAVTPSDCTIAAQSFWGSRGIQPVLIGQSVLHCQRSGSHVRDLYYSLETDGYQGNDLSVLAPHLFEGHRIIQWAYQQTPASTLWCVMENGTLLSLTYLREQNIWAWARHETRGRVLSVAVISGDEQDVVMLAVERKANGKKYISLERMQRHLRQNEDVSAAWYVDAGIVVEPEKDSEGRAVLCSGLEHLAGQTVAVLADGSPEEHEVSSDGRLELEYPASRALIGLPYTSIIAPLPLETDTQAGSTIGKKRAYGKVVVKCRRSVAGRYAASVPYSIWEPDAWKELDWYDIPQLPETWGAPCKPYSGDVEITLPSGQDEDTTVYLRQDLPLPLHIVAVACDVDFGQL